MPLLTNHCTQCENSHCQCHQPSKVFVATLSNHLSWRQASVNTIMDSAQANERLFAVCLGNFIIYHTIDMDFLIETCEDICSFSCKSTFQLPENSVSLTENKNLSAAANMCDPLEPIQISSSRYKLFADLEIACGRTKTKPLMMVRDVATRWNSTAELIERALLLREALNLLVNFEQHNKPRSSRLKRFQLAKQEWELLEKLFPMLEVTIGYLKFKLNIQI